MDPEILETLKQRFEFDAWRGTNVLGRDIIRQQVSLPQNVIEGLEPGQIREIDPGDGTRLIRASWSVPGDADSSIFIDIRECASLEQAHDIVLELLANMQAPDVERMEEPVGDVSFGRGKHLALIFARGNLAVSIRNGGDKPVAVNKYAQMIDGWIVGGESK